MGQRLEIETRNRNQRQKLEVKILDSDFVFFGLLYLE